MHNGFISNLGFDKDVERRHFNEDGSLTTGGFNVTMKWLHYYQRLFSSLLWSPFNQDSRISYGIRRIKHKKKEKTIFIHRQLTVITTLTNNLYQQAKFLMT